MMRTGSRKQLFVLGFFFGVYSYIMCTHLIVLAYFSIFFLLVSKAWREEDDDQRLDIQSFPVQDDSAPLRMRHEVLDSCAFHGQGKATAAVSSADVCHALNGSCQFFQNTILHPRNLPTDPKQIRDSRSGNFTGGRINSARRIQDASESVCSLLVETGRSERRLPKKCEVMNKEERAVILAWLRETISGKQQNVRLASVPFAITLGPVVPLTASRIAEHLGTLRGGSRSCRVCHGASDISSRSDACAQSQEAQVGASNSKPGYPAVATVPKAGPSPRMRVGDSDPSFDTFSNR